MNRWLAICLALLLASCDRRRAPVREPEPVSQNRPKTETVPANPEKKEEEKPLLKPDPTPKKSLIPSNARAARVKTVYDGDTIETESGEKIRFIGIDTPERDDGTGKPQAFYDEARALTRKLCDGREIFLELDVEAKDKYGRTLAYVWVRDGETEVMVNAEILRQGLAYVYTVGNNNRHAESLLECQREARRASRGFWKDYVLATNVVATPRGRAFHKPTCKDIRDRDDLRTFQDAGEALDLGLNPCRGCKP